MSMVTTCPQCHTRFKVTQQQLQAHQGDVRCGRCAHVFDAFASLAPEGVPPAKIEPAAVEEPSAVVEPAAEPQETVPESLPSEPLQVEALAAEVVEAPAPEPVEPQPQEPTVEPATVPETPPAPAVEAAPAPAPEAPQPQRRRKLGWLWLVGALFMLAALAGQGAYFFRNQLAAWYPEAQPTLQQACDLLGCRIGLLREADLLSIESSDLQADPAHASLVTVTATLRNRAPFPQAYPQLELTLTDAKDQMVARRVLTAAEYAPQADQTSGFPPKSDLAVKLHADLGDLKAAGYRLYLFYPQ